MRRQAMAGFAGSILGTGNGRARFSRAFATRGGSGDGDGSGAPSNGQGRAHAGPALLSFAVAGFLFLLAFWPQQSFAGPVEVVGGGNGNGVVTGQDRYVGAAIKWGGPGGPTECVVSAGITTPASCLASSEISIAGTASLTAIPTGGSVFAGWEGVSGSDRALGQCKEVPTYGAGDLEPECVSGQLGLDYVTVRANFISPPPPLPDPVTGNAAIGGAFSATLEGTVNPNGSRVTSCRFEFGPTEAYGRAAPCLQTKAEVGTGTSPVAVTGPIGPLNPGATYHYRLVVGNPTSSNVGEDRQLTLPSIPADLCANAPRRAEQGGAALLLTRCRAYELVSDGDSHGTPVLFGNFSVADSGTRSLFAGQGFGQPSSLPGIVVPAVAERGDSGWAITPMETDPKYAYGGPLGSSGASADLSLTLWGKPSAGQAPRGEVQWRFAGLDGSVTTASPLIAPVLWSGNLDVPGLFLSEGASSDLSAFVFRKTLSNSSAQTLTLLPGLSPPEKSAADLYKVEGAGTASPSLSLVNREGSAGGQIGGACGALLGGAPAVVGQNSAKLTRAMSSDGSIVFFSARAGAPAEGACTTAFPLRIFKRIGSTATVAVSASECTRVSPACAGSGDDRYLGASVDGSEAFLRSARQLTNSDTDSTDDIYAYDAMARNEVQKLSVSAVGGSLTVNFGSGGPGVSETSPISLPATAADLESALNAITNVSNGGGSVQVSGSNPYLVEFTGAPFAGKPQVPMTVTTSPSPGEAKVEPYVSGGHLTQVSLGEAVAGHPTVGAGAIAKGTVDSAADGSRVYFVAEGVLSGPNSAGSAPVAGQSNLYAFRRDATFPAGKVSFVGVLDSGESAIWDPTGQADRSYFALPSRGADGDGRFLVFTSSAKLLPADTDSQADLYRYEDAAAGELLCLTCQGEAGAGKGNDAFGIGIPAQPEGSPGNYAQIRPFASEDVTQVVFDTRERLLPALDTNVALDAYEWSEGDGLSLISGVTGSAGISRNGNDQPIPPAISADGGSVFFATDVPLFSTDTDVVTDLYVARSGGGFPMPQAALPCEGESRCQLPYPVTPSGDTPGTALYVGPGNPKRVACKKGQVRKGDKCVRKNTHRKKHKGKHRPKRGTGQRSAK